MKAGLILLGALALTAFLLGSPAAMAAVVVAQLPAAQSPAVKPPPGGVLGSAKDKDKDDDDDKECKKPKKNRPSRC